MRIFTVLLITSLYISPSAARADWRATQESFTEALVSFTAFFENFDSHSKAWQAAESRDQLLRELIRLDRNLYKFETDTDFFFRTLTSPRFDRAAAAVSLEELRESLDGVFQGLRSIGYKLGASDPEHKHVEEGLQNAVGAKYERFDEIAHSLEHATAQDRQDLRTRGEKTLNTLRKARQALDDAIARIQAKP